MRVQVARDVFLLLYNLLFVVVYCHLTSTHCCQYVRMLLSLFCGSKKGKNKPMETIAAEVCDSFFRIDCFLSSSSSALLFFRFSIIFFALDKKLCAYG